MSVYRRLLGALLLWALLPFPFNRIVLAPFWLAASVAALQLLRRPRGGRGFSPAMQNLLGLVIVVVVILGGGWQVGPIRPLGHLLMLVTAVKVTGVNDRSSFLRALPVVGLVWLVAVTSSTHVTLVAYLVLSSAVGWWVGMWVHLSGLATTDEETSRLERGLPRPRHAVAAGLAALLLAVPVFIALPRLRSPWLAAGGGLRGVSGFSAAVELSRIGPIRQSLEIALVIDRVGGGPVERSWARLRATAFDLVRSGAWAPRQRDLDQPRVRDGRAWLVDAAPNSIPTIELTIEAVKLERYLFLPEGTVAVRCPVPVLVDDAGGLVLAETPPSSLTYRVWVARRTIVDRTSPSDRDLYLPRPNPDVTAMARQITAGLDRAQERSEAIESHLQQSFRYSLANPPRSVSDPVAWFLLESRQGHCEFFAGSMVVLLRSLGVPARMVGGYSGGTYSPNGEQLVVRQANAHTWVEVWLGPEQGWQVYDPTPAEGVPGLQRIRGLQRLRWAWDQIQIAWDRYVLTFGMAEQVGLFRVTIDAAVAVWSKVSMPLVGSILAAAAAATGLLWSGRRTLQAVRAKGRRRPASATMARLERRLQRAGIALPLAATVRGIGRAAARQWPLAEAQLGELVALAERELYAAGEVGPEARRRSRRLWADLRRAMRSSRA